MQPIKELVPDTTRWLLVHSSVFDGERLVCVEYIDRNPVRVRIAKPGSSKLILAKSRELFPDPESVIQEVDVSFAEYWLAEKANRQMEED